MAKARFELPPKAKNSDQMDRLVRDTNRLEDAARARRRANRVLWRYNLWFLRGIRNFNITWATGDVGISYQNMRGELRLRYEDTLVKRQREIGRLMQMDVRPSVTRKGIGLDFIRKAAVAQVALDQLSGNLDLEKIKLHLIEDLVDIGTAGLGVWVQDSVHLGNLPVIEVIPAWELLPLPVEPNRSYDLRGRIRDRWVTKSWLQAQEGLKWPTGSDANKLRIRNVQPGYRLPGDAEPTETASTTGGPSNTQNDRDSAPTDKNSGVEWVYLREYWVEGEPNRVGRYIVKAGDYILKDLDDQDLGSGRSDLPMMPITDARYFDLGGAYGRAFVEPLIPINRQQEKMASNLFQNIIDLDLYGIKWLPTTMGMKKQVMDNLGRNRYAFFEPDYTAWQNRPFNMTPQNMGDFPAKIMGLSDAMVDRLSRESDMYSGQAPGRVDSARSMGLLYETSSIPLIPVTASIANAFANCYKVMLQEAGTLLSSDPSNKNAQAIKLSALDDAIAGIVLDPTTSSIKLDGTNPLPGPDEVKIDIRERIPRLMEKAKADLDEALQARKIDLIDYLIECIKRNIDSPLGHQGEVDSIRTSWLENIILFGDGETPGQIEQNDESDLHKLHLRIHGDFMKRPEWKFASVAVKSKFILHKQWHETQLGKWAELIPDPAALGQMPPQLAQQLMMGAPQGPPGGAGPQATPVVA